jgi:hypothetical protein
MYLIIFFPKQPSIGPSRLVPETKIYSVSNIPHSQLPLLISSTAPYKVIFPKLNPQPSANPYTLNLSGPPIPVYRSCHCQPSRQDTLKAPKSHLNIVGCLLCQRTLADATLPYQQILQYLVMQHISHITGPSRVPPRFTSRCEGTVQWLGNFEG